MRRGGQFVSFPYMVLVGTLYKRFSFFFETFEEADKCIKHFSKADSNCFIDLYCDIYEDGGTVGYEKIANIKRLEVNNECHIS